MGKLNLGSAERKTKSPAQPKSMAAEVTDPQAKAAQNNKWERKEFQTLKYRNFVLSKCETL